ncbi:MAG TPA: hypothetical protein VHF89_12150 [Solirubrobacteraceae bacterium]|nr:hypothetical protein [Solirubrobacteraceae bacterium]
MPTEYPTVRRALAHACSAIAFLLLAIAFITTADARAAGSESLTPAATGSSTLTFDLGELAPVGIRGAHLRVGYRSQRVRLRPVRRAARLRTRLTLRLSRPLSASTRRRIRLVVLFRGVVARPLRKQAGASSVGRAIKHKALKPLEPAPAPPKTDTTSSTTQPVPEPAPAPTAAPTAPRPPAGPVSWTCGFGGFRVGAWPSGCWRPYSDDSPFNQPIPAGAPSHPNSDAIVRRTLGFGQLGHLIAGDSGTDDDYNHPTYYSTPEDPVFTLHCYEDWGTCDIEGHQIRIPDAAKPAAGRDAHLTVVDQASGWEYDLYKVRSKPAGGGTLELRWGGRTRIDGDGLGSDATASQFGNLAGIIRAQEMQSARIAHALFMNASCDSGTFVYPATKNGRSCSAIGQSTTDAPPMGARFQLAMPADEIEALPVPRWKKTILHAMSEYGMYMGDTGGAWGVMMESGSTYTSFGAEDEMVRFARENGVPEHNGHYVFNLREGVDWARYLRVVDPCVAKRTC